MNVSIVVSYCSLDDRFLGPLINQLKMFTDDIIVVYFDHLLNGTPENVESIEAKIASLGFVKSMCLPYTGGNSRYYHNLARWNAIEETKHDWILYLDADEIPNGTLFKTLLENDAFSAYDAMDFRCNWYFRSATNQAVQTEHCGLLVNKKAITKELMFTEYERWSFRYANNLKYAPLITTNAGILLHHFSWVRTKEEMLVKTSAWGHRHDRNWASLIEEEFSRDFNGTDFVHRYQYVQVSDIFNIGL